MIATTQCIVGGMSGKKARASAMKVAVYFTRQIERLVDRKSVIRVRRHARRLVRRQIRLNSVRHKHSLPRGWVDRCDRETREWYRFICQLVAWSVPAPSEIEMMVTAMMVTQRYASYFLRTSAFKYEVQHEADTEKSE
jgi:hypothetical protein